ncbi:unnamed protein product [Thelazia callipaeda]|uniref:SSD domain-containing protein n=1 Tax=Thelazia callipaeda TaxID=103827 RepID=A0A0N5CK22_THECL|nr:unnamed protein product [Thelazia callipaeda]
MQQSDQSPIFSSSLLSSLDRNLRAWTYFESVGKLWLQSCLKQSIICDEENTVDLKTLSGTMPGKQHARNPTFSSNPDSHQNASNSGCLPGSANAFLDQKEQQSSNLSQATDYSLTHKNDSSQFKNNSNRYGYTKSPGHYSPNTGGYSWLQSQIHPAELIQTTQHINYDMPHRRASILMGQRSLKLIEEYEEKKLTFVKLIITIYSNWGLWIAKFAWPAITLCILVASLSLIKILRTPQRNDLKGYAPFEARSRVEYNKYLDFFSSNSDVPGIATYIFVTAKDDGSMLRPDHLNETIQVLDLTLNNITMYNPINKRHLAFSEFCHKFCLANEPVRQFYNAYLVQKEYLKNGSRPNPFLLLKYPISTLFGRNVSIQPYFFGIKLHDPKNDTIEEINEEHEGIHELFGENTDVTLFSSENNSFSAVTNMKSAKMISLQFRALHNSNWSSDNVKQWEMSVVHFFQNYQSKHLTIYVSSTTYIEEEMIRVGISLLPYLTVGFVIMCTCSVITVMIRAAYMHQNSIFKILLAIMACVTPLLGCSTAMAILFLFGMRFSSVLCVVPFLVLSIGVDSSYLMIHEWQRLTKEIRNGEKKGGSAGHRISEVLGEVGPAILISAITNILADAVGCFTSSPEIRLLCIANLFSMFMAYLYQMTFYSALMAVIGKFEIEAEEKDDRITNIVIGKGQVNIRKRSEVIRKNSKFHDRSKLYISKYIKVYVDIVTHPIIAILVALAYVVYVAISVWGITRMTMSLTPQKLFLANSPLIKLEKLRTRYQLPVFMIVSVFVETPGDLSQRSRLILLNKMVNDFENVNGSWGPSGTMYFVRDFVTFQNFLHSDHDYDYDLETSTKALTPEEALVFNNNDLATFLALPEYDFWSGFIKLQNVSMDGKNKTLKKFFFTTAYNGEKLSTWQARQQLLQKWRAVVDKPKYELFHAYVFQEDAIFMDLIDNIPTDTWQSVLGTLVCMAVVCFIFLRSSLTVAIATTCVLSICIGILGILSWWGIELDPITMAAMVISIGFTVDIPAHISYHYYRACENGPNATPQARLANCLTSVGFPALQAALSTILCVCSLLFVKIYMSEVFVKTMITCVILCNLHGLLVLPAVLSIVDRITVAVSHKKTYGSQGEQLIHRRMEEVRKKLSTLSNTSRHGLSQCNLKTDRPPIFSHFDAVLEVD